MIQLPNNKKCYNLPEQVSQNLLNIQYLAEQYKNIDELPAIWADYKTAFDADLHTFEDWTTTFEGWEHTLETYLANMSSAAVSAIAGQTIAPGVVNATASVNAPAITGDSIVETMLGYGFTKGTSTANTTLEFVYAGVVKNGNKLTFVIAANVTKLSNGYNQTLGTFSMPVSVWNKLYPVTIGGYDYLAKGKANCVQNSDLSIVQVDYEVKKYGADAILIDFHNVGLTVNDKSYLRIELTFLLSENLAS